MPTLDETDMERIKLEGEIPSAADPPSGCVFHTRCPRKIGAICEKTEPELRQEEAGHGIRCHIPLAELRQLQGDRRRGRVCARRAELVERLATSGSATRAAAASPGASGRPASTRSRTTE